MNNITYERIILENIISARRKMESAAKEVVKSEYSKENSDFSVGEYSISEAKKIDDEKSKKGYLKKMINEVINSSIKLNNSLDEKHQELFQEVIVAATQYRNLIKENINDEIVSNSGFNFDNVDDIDITDLNGPHNMLKINSNYWLIVNETKTEKKKTTASTPKTIESMIPLDEICIRKKKLMNLIAEEWKNLESARVKLEVLTNSIDKNIYNEQSDSIINEYQSLLTFQMNALENIRKYEKQIKSLDSDRVKRMEYIKQEYGKVIDKRKDLSKRLEDAKKEKKELEIKLYNNGETPYIKSRLNDLEEIIPELEKELRNYYRTAGFKVANNKDNKNSKDSSNLEPEYVDLSYLNKYCTITIRDDDGNVIDTISVEKGTTIDGIAPKQKKRNGKVIDSKPKLLKSFSGWTDQERNLYEFPLTVNEDIDVYAEYKFDRKKVLSMAAGVGTAVLTGLGLGTIVSPIVAGEISLGAAAANAIAYKAVDSKIKNVDEKKKEIGNLTGVKKAKAQLSNYFSRKETLENLRTYFATTSVSNLGFGLARII